MMEHEALVETAINFDFINQFEDQPALVGHVKYSETDNELSREQQPNQQKLSTIKGGVFVGYNLDLGASTIKELRSFNLNPTLIGKLYPYLGKQGVEAQVYLQSFALSVSKNEADAIENGAKMHKLRPLIKLYESISQTKFERIPACWQTVIVSIASQYRDLPSMHPKFWRLVTTKKWHQAVDCLRNFGDEHGLRRQKEADFIEQHL